MDIDLTTIIICIIAWSCFLIPVLYDQFSKKKDNEG